MKTKQQIDNSVFDADEQADQHRRAERALGQFTHARVLAGDVTTQLSYLAGGDASAIQQRVRAVVCTMQDIERSLGDAVERRASKRRRTRKAAKS